MSLFLKEVPGGNKQKQSDGSRRFGEGAKNDANLSSVADTFMDRWRYAGCYLSFILILTAILTISIVNYRLS